MIENLTEENIKNFRLNFRTLRVSRKLRQGELAQLMHISRQDISAIEYGRKRVTVALVESAAEALGMSADEIIAERLGRPDTGGSVVRLLSIAETVYRTNLEPERLQVVAKGIDLLETVVFSGAAR